MLSLLRDFSEIFPDTDECSYAANFTESFSLLDAIFGYLSCPFAEHAECDHNVHSWADCETKIQRLKRLWKALIGESAITPYFHVTEFHIGSMIARSPFGSIAPFSLQSQELKHQIQTRMQFRKTNQGAVRKPKIQITNTTTKKKVVRKVPLGLSQLPETTNNPVTSINSTIKPPSNFAFKKKNNYP
jgi:hypothetical protein